MANRAVFLTGHMGNWVVKDAPMPVPAAQEILIRTHAIALNPIDWKLREMNRPMNYPAILGSDVAGVVEEVGSDVTLFKKEDRVMGFSRFDKGQGAFQQYAILHQDVTASVPDKVTFEEASTLPMGLFTAAGGLRDLGVNLPGAPAGEVSGTKAVLIWGGASSMGTTAIQLAHAAGVVVFTTASPHHHEYLKKLGANFVFDYRSPDVADSIKAAAAQANVTIDKVLDAASADTPATAKVLSALGGGDLAALANAEIQTPDNVKIFFSGGRKPLADQSFSRFLSGDYWNSALNSGALVPGKLEVVPGGLEGLEAGLSKLKAGVSGVKLVVKP